MILFFTCKYDLHIIKASLVRRTYKCDLKYDNEENVRNSDFVVPFEINSLKYLTSEKHIKTDINIS